MRKLSSLGVSGHKLFRDHTALPGEAGCEQQRQCPDPVSSPRYLAGGQERLVSQGSQEVERLQNILTAAQAVRVDAVHLGPFLTHQVVGAPVHVMLVQEPLHGGPVVVVHLYRGIVDDGIPQLLDTPVEIDVLASEQSLVLGTDLVNDVFFIRNIDTGQRAHAAPLCPGGEGDLVGNFTDQCVGVRAQDRSANGTGVRMFGVQALHLGHPVGEDLGIVVSHGNDFAAAVRQSDVAAGSQVFILSFD